MRPHESSERYRRDRQQCMSGITKVNDEIDEAIVQADISMKGLSTLSTTDSLLSLRNLQTGMPVRLPPGRSTTPRTRQASREVSSNRTRDSCAFAAACRAATRRSPER